LVRSSHYSLVPSTCTRYRNRFGEESVEKMVNWALENVSPERKASILEVGSGNGTLLFGFLDAGYDPNTLHGIDYSAGAIRLSKSIAQSRRGSAISFSQCDFLNDEPATPKNMSEGHRTDVWDLILDKGTYDAIALGEKDEQGRLPVANYPGRVARLLKPGGLFLITSCNFIEDELKRSFATVITGLTYHSRIQHPTFTFGGKSGSVYTSVAFRRG